MEKINFALSWYFASLTTFFFSIILLIYISTSHFLINTEGSNYQKYKALPSDYLSIKDQSITIGKKDARSLLVENFFKSYKSPLSESADTFISVADKYNLDYRLMPAIAMQESNGAKRLPADSYNPFGYGIYGSKIMRFNSFDEAIERVGRGLKEDYIDEDLKTPQEIMAKYTPPSLAKGGPWAIGVSTFMEEIF